VQHDDAAGERPGHGNWGTRLVAAVCLAAYAWWVVALAPFSWGATAAVVLAGAAAMAVGARERRGRPSAGEGATGGMATWAALAAAAGAWQLAAYLQHPRADHPTVSSLTSEVLDSHLARAVAFVVWIVAARGLARR
jgi:hypothetical protein